ncbi:hypothetical protein [Mycoplasmopsis gallopavonis]|uniref:DNA polymerase III subunit delta n=1 Tax=Mycoplasmopsis gallopavonis TaxID=76629 RepID=A0A449AZK5_9BACT|nr:hypothetical protein [Mycoplasmopsis gallopavonis]RIV16706.1 hypothetical protein D1113_01360 [Mycoplasmopsis gallopavonis]VEU72932.1 DNA polymerase III subunit delta' [Mycoplasmopsis gallopavonis]
MLNLKIEKAIKQARETNKLNHLYLLIAQSKYQIDLDLANFISLINQTNLEISYQDLRNNNLPSNISFLDGSKDDIFKENLENILSKIYFTSNNLDANSQKIIVIKNIENASNIALNAILKTIEEPTNNVQIVLTTNHFNQVLPTITSRAQKIPITPESPRNLYANFIRNGILEPFAEIACYLAGELFTAKEYSKDEYIDLFNNLSIAFVESIKRNKTFLYAFLTEHLVKENPQNKDFLISAIKLIIEGHFKLKNATLKNKYVSRIIQISEKLNEHFPNLINFLADLNHFESSLAQNANFNLQKETLLIKLMEYYE